MKINDRADNDPVQHQHMSFWDRFAEMIAANPWRLIFFWLLVFGVSVPPAVVLQDHLTPARTIAGTESAYVDQLIAGRFDKDSRHGAVLVLAGLRPAHDAADWDILKSTVKAARAWPQVLRATSIIDFWQSSWRR